MLVLMSADDYDSWQETVYLLRSPENARRLMEAVARDQSRHSTRDDYTKSMDELQQMAGGEE
jgi:antitoxin YefM